MNISHESLEIILDLIEIKVNSLQVHDKDDVRELNKLRKCKQELLSLLNALNTKSPKRNESEAPPLEKSHYPPLKSKH